MNLVSIYTNYDDWAEVYVERNKVTTKIYAGHRPNYRDWQEIINALGHGCQVIESKFGEP